MTSALSLSTTLSVELHSGHGLISSARKSVLLTLLLVMVLVVIISSSLRIRNIIPIKRVRQFKTNYEKIKSV